MSLKFRFYQLHVRCIVGFAMKTQAVVNGIPMSTDWLLTKQVGSHHSVTSIIIHIIGLTEYMLKVMLHLSERLPLAGF